MPPTRSTSGNAVGSAARAFSKRKAASSLASRDSARTPSAKSERGPASAETTATSDAKMLEYRITRARDDRFFAGRPRLVRQGPTVHESCFKRQNQLAGVGSEMGRTTSRVCQSSGSRQPCPHLAFAEQSARGMISGMGTGYQGDVVRRAGCVAARGTIMRLTVTTTRPQTRTTTWGSESPGSRPVPRKRGTSVRSETARSAEVLQSPCDRAVSGPRLVSRAA